MYQHRSAVARFITFSSLLVFSKNAFAAELPVSGTANSKYSSFDAANLMQHRGGWDHKSDSDPTYDTAPISKALGIDRPPNPTEIATYMSGQPLQFDPGSKYAYSNLGYMLLGLVIEKISGSSVHDFV